MIDNEEQSSYKKGLDYAVRILSSRDYSTYKLKQKLKSRGIDHDDTKKVIDQLLAWNYLREDEYIKQRIKQLIIKGHANSLILQKLEQEYLSSTETVINEIRSDQGLSSESQLDILIEKKLRHKEIPTDHDSKMKLKNKVTRFLVSKGYSFDEISEVLKKYI